MLPITIDNNRGSQLDMIGSRHSFQIRFSHLMAPKATKVMKSRKAKTAMDATKALKATKASTQAG